MNQELKLSVRARPGNANHHLWNNNGTFWCHLTVHLADFTKQRLRVSLETGDVEHARRLRDSLIRLFGGAPGEEPKTARGDCPQHCPLKGIPLPDGVAELSHLNAESEVYA
jgi:hypothetical protein